MTTENTQPTTPKTKRVYSKRFIEFPLNETFSAFSLAQKLNEPIHAINNAIKRNIVHLDIVGTTPSTRGRAKKLYQYKVK